MSESPIRQTINLPPNETAEFFRAKGTYPISRRWWEVWQEEYARSFTVSGITNRRILEEVRAPLSQVIENGGTFAQWKEQTLPILKAAVENGTAPEGILTDLRLTTIYQTNLRMARAAGQWKRIEALKERAPFLMYVAVDDSHTRPLHRLWGGLDGGKAIILPVDHPAWNWLFPPNGWGCRCHVIQLSQRDLDMDGLTVTTDAELAAMGLPTSTNLGGDLQGVDTASYIRGDGVIEDVVKGVDPGFNYNVGKAHMRGLVPPPVSGPISEPFLIGQKGVAELPPLPNPRPKSPTDLLLKDAPYDVVADTFIDSFGKRNSAGAVQFIDALGESLIIDDSFFYRGGVRGDASTEKLVDSDRRIHIRLIADALKDPDEIWYVWEEVKTPNGGTRMRLTRRYVARYAIGEKTRPMVVVMQIGPDGWNGVTAIAGRSGSYANAASVRGGVLAYRRK